jgi:hypothetical protein
LELDMTPRSFQRLFPAACAALVLSACSEPAIVAGPSLRPTSTDPRLALLDPGAPGLIVICSSGGPSSYSVSAVPATGTLAGGGSFSVADGACVNAWTAGAGDLTVTTITVTQTAGDFVSVEATAVPPTGLPFMTIDPATKTVSWMTNADHGGSATFFQSPPPPPPPPPAEGRMTGGGGQLRIDDLYISRGFTIHCDITLSNNIEINWPDNKWHLDKPITSARCIDDPAFDEAPPRAPFNTFIGTAVGRLNGVDGSRLEFTFIDGGEPGKKNDMASLKIWDANDNLVLDVPLSALTHGNIQAHYDQPHGSNWNRP